MTLPGRKRQSWQRLGAIPAAMAVVVATVVATMGAAPATAHAAPAAAAAAQGTILLPGGATAVAGSYVVVFKESAVSRADVAGRAGELALRYGGTVARTYRHALRGFEVRLPEAAARRLAADPAVRYVQQSHSVGIASTQSPTPSWGLDRIDQRNLPLNNSYTYPNPGAGVKAYVIDTGIHFTHSDFGGRAVSGFDAVDGGSADDCHGHGTHVAGTVGGTAHGVAKSVSLVGVRVLDCDGAGTDAAVIAGIDWVTGNHQPGQLAVANMSLGGAFDHAINDAVAASIADGVVYAIAAGNGFANDACGLSPASAPAAITVGATELTDVVADYSSIGPCLDIFAPGTDITSAWIEHDFDTETISGTSMATPHVAGAAAIVLAASPGFTPQQVRDTLVSDAIAGVLPNPGLGSPNRLLRVMPTRDASVAVSPPPARSPSAVR